ncbi:MAG: hypothetical protein V1781_06880 [Bacteroidota bacterium]
MKYPRYEYCSENQLMYYEFTSEGLKGKIKKLVEYSATSVENVYNLAFGDYDESIDSINDKSITNNGDSQKVLATVASTVYAFTGHYPNAWVHVTGSTNVRTRLYRMGITNNITEITDDFFVFGLQNDKWEPFIVGEDYEAFLITRKNKNIKMNL